MYALKAQDKYTSLYCAEGELLIKQSIKQLESQLDPKQFLRIHRNSLVNLQHIQAVERSLDGQMHIQIKNSPITLAVSRAKQHLFKAH